MIAACASVSLGIIETYIAALLGYIIDVVIETPPNQLFVEHWPFLLTAIGFLTLVRPTSFLFPLTFNQWWLAQVSEQWSQRDFIVGR